MDIQNEKNLREQMIKKYLKELVQRTGRTEDELLSEGLLCSDFKHNVMIVHEDGSTSNYRYAFLIENADCYAVFTEHCSYHEFKREWLEEAYEYGAATNTEKLVRVKWIGSNSPCITFQASDESVYPTKRELLCLYKELKKFVNYYQDDFSENKIDLEDEFDI